MENTAIEWTDHTWNPWLGCAKVHTGCAHCYASALLWPECGGEEPDCERGDCYHEPPPAVQWVIVGGESGDQARPMHPDWVRGLRDQCKAAGVPFFFKQWGEFLTIPIAAERGYMQAETAMSRGDSEGYLRVGKKAAGRMLGGRDHSEVPAHAIPF